MIDQPEPGRLYQTARYVILSFDRPDLIPEIDIKIDTTTIPASQRKLRARWSPEMAQDLGAWYGVQNDRFVPKGSVVMYVETHEGLYKLIHGEEIGWTQDTLNLLEEISE